MDLDSFSRALGGGALIGLAASLLLWVNGRVVGVSGMLGGAVVPVRGDVLWRVLALLGLVAAGAFAMWLAPDQIGRSPRPGWMLALAGLLVGAGTQLSKGCTSGHGVCGVSRLSPRSLAATGTFVVTAMATVWLLKLVREAP